MDFEIRPETQDLLDEFEQFLSDQIDPLVEEYPSVFGARREDGRTNWEDGTPSETWSSILNEMTDRSDEAGFYRLQLPPELGGESCSQLTLSLLREHLNRRGPPTDSPGGAARAIVGNFDVSSIIYTFGDESQRQNYALPMIERELYGAFGLTEPTHGSDVTHMDTVAWKEGDEWVLDGAKRYISFMHKADIAIIYARTGGDGGDHSGITAFLVPTDADGFDVPYFHWTMMMPTEAGEIELDEVRVPEDAVLGEVGAGLKTAQLFLHEGRIRQAAESLGAAQFAIDESVRHAKERETWNQPLANRQSIQFMVSELQTEAELVRSMLYRTAWLLDQAENNHEVSDKVSMVNYRGNRLACDALDTAMQIHGGRGYSRHTPFEYLYRYFRRYRITEGTDEIQKRNVAGHLFGFIGE